jgi:hypothetical protein
VLTKKQVYFVRKDNKSTHMDKCVNYITCRERVRVRARARARRRGGRGGERERDDFCAVVNIFVDTLSALAIFRGLWKSPFSRIYLQV